MSNDPLDIHRASEVSRLARIIEDPPEGLSIVAVSGPGGVGKTFLLSHVLETVQIEKLGYLLLRADGSNAETREDFFGIVEGQLFRRSLPPPANRDKDYFPRVREIAAIHRGLVEKAMSEIRRSGVSDEVRRAAATLLSAGRILNATIPQTKRYLDTTSLQDAEIQKSVDAAWELLKGLKGLKDSTHFPGPVRDLFGITRQNRVKHDLYSSTATELRVDLSAALVGWEKKDGPRLTHDRIVGLDRLMIVLDDYEAIHPLLGDFLVGALVPELSTAPFRTVLVILGRDDLETTHPGWSQHCRRFLRDQIRLTPFDEASANDLFAAAGIAEDRWQTLFAATQGYPFLISLVVEEAGSYEAGSVVFLRRFYDRTTRWMTDRERDWFLNICYLDRVNEDTLPVMFPGESVSTIQDWFEREPSIRDPAATYFRVRPLIREKMLRYQEVRAPSRHRELVALAGRANAMEA